jgi:dTMP kinase
MANGKFIIFEGTDGSGKTTQFNLTKEYLEGKGHKVKTLDFPRYGEFWGQLLGRFLSGEFGELEDVDPYIITPIYLLDQVSQNNNIRSWLEEGYIVMSNRYVTSNMAHQSAKISDPVKREQFLSWFKRACYSELNAVKEDMTIVLYASPEVTVKNALKDFDRKQNYTNGKLDIAEMNTHHQISSAQMYFELSHKIPTWNLIDCMKEEKMDTIENVQKKIVKLISQKLII